MNKYIPLIASIFALILSGCIMTSQDEKASESDVASDPSKTQVDRFADVEVLRYEINGFDQLSVKQKLFVYYLSQAGLAGRDIIYDQNNPYNLSIRKAMEHILENYKDDKSKEYQHLLTYAKQVWFSNGIHHHYGMDKFHPKFSRNYLDKVLSNTGYALSEEVKDVLFNPLIEAKRKVKDPKKDMIQSSANGFYGPGVTQEMVEKFYKQKAINDDNHPVEHGLNSTLILSGGQLKEDVWKSNGKYGKAIAKIIYWLEKAIVVAENESQVKALEKLIEYYKTGDLKTWDEYNVLWTKSTAGDIDWINGFIEVYGDALGKRASYESIVQITDFEASKQMSIVAKNAQWFEDHSPLLPEHKKKNVVGVSYKVVQVASESGDASPSTPIGVNLPNNNWIRQEVGSKSVSLGNIIEAYEKAGGPGLLKEFAHDQEEVDRCEKYGYLAGKIHTALHEVVGHASGQINEGVGQPAETLKNYASTLEEARADLVGLYFIMDKKLVDLKLIPSLEVGKAEYDNYIRNGMLTQLQRLELGKDVEEEHMQNRQLVASWVIEKGQKEQVIKVIDKNGKRYYDIQDYDKLRVLFGDLLREIQRIKSEGDYKAGRELVEKYGVRVDREIHAQVLKRVKPLNMAPYRGFVNPIFVPVLGDDGAIIDIKIENKQSFVEQMLHYGKHYSYLD